MPVRYPCSRKLLEVAHQHAEKRTVKLIMLLNAQSPLEVDGMKKVNVSILGYGFAQLVFHTPCYKEIPEANVIAVGGRRKEVAEEFAARWGIKKIYSGEHYIILIEKYKGLDLT